MRRERKARDGRAAFGFKERLRGLRRGGARRVLAITIVEEGGFEFRLMAVDARQISLAHEYFPVTEDDDVPGAFRAAGHPLQGGMDVVLLLPRRHVLVKPLSVPTRDRDQIALMVPYEANAQSPWPREETLCAYDVHTGETGTNSTLTLYLVRSAWVEERLGRLARHRVRPTRVEVSTRALERVLEGTEPGARLLIRFAGETEYVRLLPGGGSYSRAASGASEVPSETLRRSMELERKQGNTQGPLGPLFLAGCGPEVVEALPPEGRPEVFATLEESAPPNLQDFPSPTPESVLALGAVRLTEEATESANLLPPSYRRWLEPRRLLLRARFAAFLLAWSAAMLGGLGYYHYQDQVRRAETARERIAGLGSDLGDLEAKSEALRLLRAERGRVGLPLAVVLELYDKTPSQIAISTMRFESRGLLILGCEAPDFQALFTFLDALKSSDLFEAVELLSSSRPQHASGGLVEFKVQTQLRAARGGQDS